ncbi:hypothetical protein ABZW18_12840 [Streptomyces sp. NPDC004647]|uniref:hypothetical protein n=1 Tax=Streptomyces sp. NPDC004647 TaxID=3154671 RepID=UPI0033A07DD3
MRSQGSDAPSGRRENHHTRTDDRGSFSLARCSCGWAGPARRARGRAREDADTHLTDLLR